MENLNFKTFKTVFNGKSIKSTLLALVGVMCFGVNTAQAQTYYAQVTINGTTTNYTSVEAAWNAALADGVTEATIKALMSESSLHQLRAINGTSGYGKNLTKLTLDLNGKTWGMNGFWDSDKLYFIKVDKAGFTLTIKDDTGNGYIHTGWEPNAGTYWTVTSGSFSCLSVYKGTVKLQSGGIKCRNADETGAKENFCVYVSTSGNFTMLGGSLEVNAYNNVRAIYNGGSGLLNLAGGTITATAQKIDGSAWGTNAMGIYAYGTPSNSVDLTAQTSQTMTINVEAGSSARGVYATASAKVALNGNPTVNVTATNLARAVTVESATSTITVNGGTYNVEATTQTQCVNAHRGVVTVNGGTFNATTESNSSSVIGAHATVDDKGNAGKINITGGTFNVKSTHASMSEGAIRGVYLNGSGTEINISGGTFTCKKNDAICGFAIYANGTGQVTVKHNPVFNATTTIRSDASGTMVTVTDGLFNGTSTAAQVYNGGGITLNGGYYKLDPSGSWVGTGKTVYNLSTAGLDDPHYPTYGYLIAPTSMNVKVKVGNERMYYTNLNAALDTAKQRTNPTIELMGNTTFTGPYTLTSPVTAWQGTLDLKTDTITSTLSSGDRFFSFSDSDAKLTIKGTTGQWNFSAGYNGTLFGIVNGYGEVKLEGGKLYAENNTAEKDATCVYSSGTFTQTGGTVEAQSPKNTAAIRAADGGVVNVSGGTVKSVATTGSYPAGIWMYVTSGSSSTPSVTVSGGTIHGEATAGSSSWGIRKEAGTLTINAGATVEASAGTAYARSIYCINAGTTTINGGTITASSGNGSGCIDMRGGTMTINGGSFTPTGTTTTAVLMALGGTLNVQGGTFTATSGTGGYGINVHSSGSDATVNVNSTSGVPVFDVKTGINLAAATGTVNVSAGKFKCATDIVAGSAGSTASFSGGYFNEKSGTTFKTQVENKCADGKHAVDLSGSEKAAPGMSDYSYKVVTGYAVTYGSHTNGDFTIKVEDGAASSATKYAASGQTVTLAATPNTNYHLASWTVTKAGGGTVTVTSNQFTMPAQAVTVVANFAEDTHTVTVAAGSNGSVSPTSVSGVGAVTTSGDITATPNTGYRFTSWTLPSGVTAAAGYTTSSNPIRINATADSKTITANFAARQYTITLNNQGATSAGTTSITATYNSNTYLTGNPAISKPTKTNYSFNGYYTSTLGAGTQIIDADGCVNASVSGYTDASKNWKYANDLTLYAQWIQTVTLNAHGGTGGTASMTVTFNSSSHAAITNPTRTGYTFNGWYTAESGGTLVMNTSGVLQANVSNYTGAGGIWTRTASGSTLHAQWTPKSCTVNFDKEGGSGGTNSTTATYDEAMTTITPPTKANYEFAGYWDGDNGTGTQYYNADGTSTRTWNKNTTSATTLYAKWTAAVASVTPSGGSASYYSTLAKAFAAANAATAAPTIKILQSVSGIAATMEYNNSSVNGTLDLNNCTLEGTVSPLLKVNGTGRTLTVKDDSGSKNGKIYLNKSVNDVINAVQVKLGKLILNNGKIEAKNTSTGTSAQARGVYVTGGQELEVNNGTIEATSKQMAYAVFDYDDPDDKARSASTITINNGTIKATTTGASNAYGIRSRNSTVTVSGGTFTVTAKNSNAFGVYNIGGSLTINGGTIEATAQTGSTAYGIQTGYVSGKSMTFNIPSSSTVDVTATSYTTGAQAINIGYSSGTIAGGTYRATSRTRESAYGVYMNANAVTISGGTFTVEAGSELAANNEYKKWAWGAMCVRGTLTISGGTFNVSTDNLAAGAYAYAYYNTSEKKLYKGDIRISGTAVFNVESRTSARGVYTYFLGATINSVNQAIAGVATVSGGTFNVNATGSNAYGIFCTGASTYQDADKAYAVSATVYPKITTTGGKFYVTGTGAVATNTSASATNNVIEGGYYSVNGGLSTYTAPTKTCDYRVFDVVPALESKYNYKVARFYTIAYNKGASGTGDNVTDYKAHGDNITLRGVTFTRTGYTQTGWSTSDGGAKTHELSATYSTNAALTLYPTWTANTTTVTLNANTANHGSGANQSVTATYGSALPSFTATTAATGYHLIGYYTAATSGTKVINADGTFAANSGIWNRTDGATLTLYAHYEANTYQVRFNGNGNTGGSMSNESFTYDAAAKALTANAFTKTNYHFIGWATSAGGDVTYADGASVRNLTTTNNGIVDLYAKWAIDTYTVTVTQNYAYGTESPSSVTSVPHGSSITVSSNTFTVNGTTVTATPKSASARYAYTFNNWTKGDGTALPATVTGDLTIRANYTRATRQYNIVWKSEDGTSTLETDADQYYGSTTAYNGSTPTKASTAQYSYTFDGWTTAANGGGTYYANGSTPDVEGAATYYAHFSASTRSYTIRFLNYNGTVLQSTSVNYGVTPTYSGSTPARAADASYTYTFTGWSPTIAAVTGAQDYTAQFSTTDNVASVTINGTPSYYTTLADAFAAANESDTYEPTIKILQTVNGITTALSYTNTTKNGTLDLNNCTLKTTTLSTLLFVNSSNSKTLTITDTSDSKNGKIHAESNVTWLNAVIVQKGKLIVNNGKIYGKNTNTDTSNGTRAVYLYEGQQLEVNNGTLEAEGRQKAYAIYDNDDNDGDKTRVGSTITINNGTFTATTTVGTIAYGVISKNSTVNVSGGSISATTKTTTAVGITTTGGTLTVGGCTINATAQTSGATGITGTLTNVTVNSGTSITATTTTTDAIGVNISGATLTINGGTINANASTSNAYGIQTNWYNTTYRTYLSIPSSSTVTVNATAATSNARAINATYARHTIQAGTYNATTNNNVNAYGIYARTEYVTVSGGTFTVEAGKKLAAGNANKKQAYGIYMERSLSADNPVKVNGSASFTVKADSYAYGLYATSIASATSRDGTRNSFANIQGGSFAVTAATNAWGVYTTGNKVQMTISEATIDTVTTATVAISGGVFTVTSTNAIGIQTTKTLTQGSFSRSPKTTVTGGKFKISGSGALAVYKEAGLTNSTQKIQGGYYSINGNLEDYCVSPKHAIQMTAAECTAQSMPENSYKVVNAYTLTWAANGGTLSGSYTPNGLVAAGATLTAPTATKTGHTFAGWHNGSSVVTPTTMPSANTTYTAQWTPINYTVTVSRNNTGYGTVSASSVTAPYGSAITVSSNTFTVNGTTVTATPAATTAQYTYAFSSWTNASGTITGDRTITANFTRTTRSYNIVWKSEDGSATLETDASQAYGATTAFNGSTPTKATTESYTYTFDGWTTAANGGGTYYANGSTPTVGGAATYYAHFSATENVASVTAGGDPTYYTTIKAAFDAANDASADVTIKLLATCSSSEVLTFAPTNAINGTLDLNNKTLTGSVNQVLTINKSGKKFTIQDTSGSKNGLLLDTLDTNTALNAVILSAGTLEVNSGHIRMGNPSTAGTSGQARGIYVSANCTLTVSGTATVKAICKQQVYGILASGANSKVTISGGTVTAATKSGATAYGVRMIKTAFTMSAGTINASATSSATGVYDHGGESAATMEITGGTINATTRTGGSAYGIYPSWNEDGGGSVLTIPAGSTLTINATAYTTGAYAIYTSWARCTIAAGTYNATTQYGYTDSGASVAGFYGTHINTATISGGTWTVTAGSELADDNADKKYAWGVQTNRGTINISGGTFTVTGGRTVAGVYARGHESTATDASYQPVVNVSGGTFNITAKVTDAWGIYAYHNGKDNVGHAGTINVTGGTFNVTSPSSKGIYVAAAKAYGTATATPRANVSGGKFNVTGTGAVATSTTATNTNEVITGGYYSVDGGLSNYTAPTKDCNYTVEPTTAADREAVGSQYLWKVGDFTNIFQPSAASGVWSAPANWSKGVLPTIESYVTIQKPCSVDIATAAAKSIVLDQNGKTGQLNIGATKALEVAGTITRTTTGADRLATRPQDLILESAAAGNATLLFDNSNDNQALVQMYSMATYPENGTAQWQYVGTPFVNTKANPNYAGSWLYKWRDATSGATFGWDVVSNEDYMLQWWGYCLTQREARTLDMEGQLLPTDELPDQNMNFQSSVVAGTPKVCANSWTAPIQIAQMEDADFVNVDQTIYLFNTGKATSGAAGEAGSTPGHYIAVPIHDAGIGGLPAQISSMQGFYVKKTGTAPEAHVALNYSRHVRPADGRSIAQGAMKTPKFGLNKPQWMKIIAQGSRYGATLYLVSREDFTYGYDGGWDGENINSAGAGPLMYSPREDGTRDAVSAIPVFEGALVGFEAGEDKQYTFSFTYDGDEEWYLNDLKLGISTLINAENSYTFAPTGDDTKRFVISAKPTTEVSGTDDKARKVIVDDKLYIIRSGRIYDGTGKIVKDK